VRIGLLRVLFAAPANAATARAGRGHRPSGHRLPSSTNRHRLSPCERSTRPPLPSCLSLRATYVRGVSARVKIRSTWHCLPARASAPTRSSRRSARGHGRALSRRAEPHPRLEKKDENQYSSPHRHHCAHLRRRAAGACVHKCARLR
jgi:hypothetical protein